MTKKIRFADLPDVKESTKINLNQYNYTYLELLCWLDNNTSVKQVLKYEGEDDYYVFFKNKQEEEKLIAFLSTKNNIEKAA